MFKMIWNYIDIARKYLNKKTASDSFILRVKNKARNIKLYCRNIKTVMLCGFER